MNWKLKDVLMVAICAVLFGVVFLGATYAGGLLYGLLAPVGMGSLGYEPFYGIYFMAGAFGIYVMAQARYRPDCGNAGRHYRVPAGQLFWADHHSLRPGAGIGL